MKVSNLTKAQIIGAFDKGYDVFYKDRNTDVHMNRHNEICTDEIDHEHVLSPDEYHHCFYEIDD